MSEHADQGHKVVPYKTAYLGIHYEVGILRGSLVAACDCGAGSVWVDDRQGRAEVAEWRDRHTHLDGVRGGPLSAWFEDEEPE